LAVMMAALTVALLVYAKAALWAAHWVVSMAVMLVLEKVENWVALMVVRMVVWDSMKAATTAVKMVVRMADWLVHKKVVQTVVH
jgi:hypothetical protein